MNKKDLLAIVCVLAITLSFIYSGMVSTNSVNYYKHVSALYETAVTHQVKHNGVWGPIYYDGHNLVTSTGLNFSVGKIFGVPNAGAAPFTVIALGNYSNITEAMTFINNTASNTAIADCTLTPTNVTTPLYVSLGNVSMSALWTSGCNNEIVNTTALYNYTTNGTSNAMFAGKNFSASVTLQSGDQLNVTWYVWATSG